MPPRARSSASRSRPRAGGDAVRLHAGLHRARGRHGDAVGLGRPRARCAGESVGFARRRSSPTAACRSPGRTRRRATIVDEGRVIRIADREGGGSWRPGRSGDARRVDGSAAVPGAERRRADPRSGQGGARRRRLRVRLQHAAGTLVLDQVTEVEAQDPAAELAAHRRAPSSRCRISAAPSEPALSAQSFSSSSATRNASSRLCMWFRRGSHSDS